MRSDRIALLLPEIYRRSMVAGTPLATLLEVMEALHEPVERILSELPVYFDPQHTPDRFVPFLARWVDLARWLEADSEAFDTGTGRLRQVIAASAQLSRMRGTSAGLTAALEWAIGVDGVRIQEEVQDASGRILPFHVIVTVPHAAAAHEGLVRRIVQQEKPAHVTADVVFIAADATTAPVAPSSPAPTAPPAEPPTLPVGGEQPDSEPAFPGTERVPPVTTAPDEPVPADPAPTDPAPANPVPANPVPADPTSAAPGPDTPASDESVTAAHEPPPAVGSAAPPSAEPGSAEPPSAAPPVQPGGARSGASGA